MSLYEISSMNIELEKMDQSHKPQVSDDEWAQAEALLQSVTLNDPSVLLH